MKLVIAGSRTINLGIEELAQLIGDNNLEPSLIISGGARGVDTTARLVALAYEVPFKEVTANWEFDGRAAGHIRNAVMAKLGDALLLVWDGQSKGSANMKMNMEKLGKPVYEVILK